MAQKISQMTEQTTASMTEAGTSDFLGGYTATGGNANRKFSLSGLANYFLNKFKMTLGGSSQTVKSALDTLNSKTTAVNGSFTEVAEGASISFVVRYCSGVVVVNGYATFPNVSPYPSSSLPLKLCKISGVPLPSNYLRIVCNAGSNAWSANSIGYLSVDTTGEIQFMGSAVDTSAIFCSFSYIP